MHEALNKGVSRRNRSKNGQNGQWTDPSTGESRDKSCPKMTKMANERTLQQGNSMRKVRKNERNLQNPVKNVGKPRTRPEASRNTRGSLTLCRCRTLPQLSRNLPKVQAGIAIENTLKTHRVTQSARDIIYPEISGRLNQRFTRNVQGRGIVAKSEQ